MEPMLMARSLGGLAFVLALLAGALFVVRRFDIKLPGRVGGGPRGRLGVVERVAIDPKRALVLVRRDGREHLILLSPEGHVVIDDARSGGPGVPESFAARIAPEPASDPSFRFEPWLEPADIGTTSLRLVRHA